MLIVNFAEHRVIQKTNLWACLWEFLNLINWRRRSKSKCGWHHSRGWGPECGVTENDKMTWKPHSALCFLNVDRSAQPPHTLVTMPSSPRQIFSSTCEATSALPSLNDFSQVFCHNNGKGNWYNVRLCFPHYRPEQQLSLLYWTASFCIFFTICTFKLRRFISALTHLFI